jgi:quercetin dioxygenase-like cupin family protein
MLPKKVMLVTAKLPQFAGLFLWLVLALVVVVLRVGHAQQSGAQKPAAAPAQPALITGTSTTSEPTGVTLGRRKFEPASRTYWHSHPGGQLLLIEQGRALVQEQGKPVRTLAPGESIFTGPNVLHWHGATPTQAMTQLNVGFPGGATKWMDPVTDAQYSGKAK